MAKNGTIGVTTENIVPVIKKFLYSDHEIFLRELVSNAVDATQKLKTLASTGVFNGDLGNIDIQVSVNAETKTLTVTDRGIGMTAEEVDKYINQIAFSVSTLHLWYLTRLRSSPSHTRRSRSLYIGAATALRSTKWRSSTRSVSVAQALCYTYRRIVQSIARSRKLATCSANIATSCLFQLCLARLKSGKMVNM